MMTTHDEKMNDRKKMCIEELRAIKVLGKGAMGCVLLVQGNHGCHEQPFALKVMRKNTKDDHWLTKLRRIHREREILSSLHHPFLPFLMGEVETDFMVGWATEHCPGGDLHRLRQIQPDRSFSESEIRFYAAEIVLALEYLHSKGIVYRDLKPENILVQSSGHIMLTDFDLSKRLEPISNESEIPHNQEQQKQHTLQRGGWPVLRRMLSSKAKNPCPSTQVSPALNQNPHREFSRTNSFVGTDEYVAPEIINGEGHEFSVDWWSLGILLYELLYGTTPFKGSNKKETFTRILMMNPKLMGTSTPLQDLILRLLEKNPRKRLGFFNGAVEIKMHSFFTGLQWGSIHNVCRPPFVPNVDNTYHYCTDNLLKSEMESILHAINIVSVSESDEEQTTDSEVDGLF